MWTANQFCHQQNLGWNACMSYEKRYWDHNSELLIPSYLQIKGGIHLIFFLFLHENICCGYSLEATSHGASYEYHNICFRGEIRKLSILFHWKTRLSWSYALFCVLYICFCLSEYDPKDQFYSMVANRSFSMTWLLLSLEIQFGKHQAWLIPPDKFFSAKNLLIFYYFSVKT